MRLSVSLASFAAAAETTNVVGELGVGDQGDRRFHAAYPGACSTDRVGVLNGRRRPRLGDPRLDELGLLLGAWSL
jgi:hypothetical protein